MRRLKQLTLLSLLFSCSIEESQQIVEASVEDQAQEFTAVDPDIDPEVFAAIDEDESQYKNKQDKTQKLISSIIQKHLDDDNYKKQSISSVKLNNEATIQSTRHNASPANNQTPHVQKQQFVEKKQAAAAPVQQLSEEDEFMKPFVDLDNQAKLFEQMQEKDAHEKEERVKEDKQKAERLRREQIQKQQKQASDQARLKAQKELAEKQKAMEASKRKLMQSAAQMKLKKQMENSGNQGQQQQQVQQQKAPQLNSNQQKIYEQVNKRENQGDDARKKLKQQAAVNQTQAQPQAVQQPVPQQQQPNPLQTLYEKSQNLLDKANSLSKDQVQFQVGQQILQPQGQNANMTQEEKEREMALKLSETFRILEQQEKRAKEEKSEIGHDLFQKANEMLKQTTDVAEEAGIKLAATIYGKNGAEVQPEIVPQSVPQSAEVVADNNAAQKEEVVQQEQAAPAEVPTETKNESTIDVVKQQMSQIYKEQKENATKKTEKDTLKDEILGVITKALDDKDKKQTTSSFFNMPMQPQMSVVQRSKDALSEANIDVDTSKFIPHTEFNFGTSGQIQMNPFHTSSQVGELEKTHEEIIQMQNQMIEKKQNKLLEHSLKFNDFTDDDDADHFVDFGLVELNEKSGEDQDDRAWLKRFTSAPESESLLELDLDLDEDLEEEIDKDDDANSTTVLFHNGKAKIVPSDQKIVGESPRLAQPINFMILSLDSRTGIFKMKQYNRTHLSEVREMFEDVLNIRSNNSEVIMVGNQKMINKTRGDFETPMIQALIGKAIQKKFLPFEYTTHTQLNANSNTTSNVNAGFALQIKSNQTKLLSMENQEIKKAIQEKEKKITVLKKNGKQMEKQKSPKKNCTEPEVLIDSAKGSVIKICSGQNVPEWKSLTLLGKLALTDRANKSHPFYNRLYQTESELGLKLYTEVNKGE